MFNVKPTPAVYSVLVFMAAIVKLSASVYVNVILAPLTIFISCVPLPAPLSVNLNSISLVDWTHDVAYSFWVLVSAAAISIVLASVLDNVTLVPPVKTIASSVPSLPFKFILVVAVGTSTV